MPILSISKRAIWLIGGIIIVSVFVVLCLWLYRDYINFTETPLSVPSSSTTFEIQSGAGFNHIAKQLQSAGYTKKSIWYWRILATQMHVAKKLHVGEYAITYETTPKALLLLFSQGKVIQHHFTIIEGWQFHDLRQALAKDPFLTHQLNDLSDTEIMAYLATDDDITLEGQFLPETYAFVKGNSDLQILKRAYQAMQKTLQNIWDNENQNIILKNKYELLTLASIIEKETGRADERALIAGVFTQRLIKGMKLQTDPSVIYGLGKSFDGNLTRLHLTTDTTYNTYTRTGLPPTPIALPGVASLEAAAQPEKTDALYFVAKGDGSHIFNATYEGHLKAVQEYQLRKR